MIETQEQSPSFDLAPAGDGVRLTLSGAWTLDHGRALEQLVDQIESQAGGARQVLIDMAGLSRLDTLGAHLIDRMTANFGSDGAIPRVLGARTEHETLLAAVRYRATPVRPRERHRLFLLLEDIGRGVVGFGRDAAQVVSFIGEVVVAMGRLILNPSKFRGPSLINQIEQIAFRGAPIIILISFLVGCIVAQQGIFQLRRFGATAFVVDLVGIITLRELALLLTAIMIAGRSGSAFTAEIGSMKMREEIDALRVMGLNPVDVLVVPRMLALIISLPILTFLAGIAGLTGAGIVAWLYGGIAPETYLARLQSVINIRHFSVGLIKAPFMAMVIGAIACLEGLNVKGSAESLGQQVTASVVKAIFMVIVVDGLFAMFFAAIRF
jgi:phospholipid/cholesterol/gamma-HCH transport system permease protein